LTQISLTPGLSRAPIGNAAVKNCFNSFLGADEKPLKRFPTRDVLFTQLKLGVNENGVIAFMV